MQAAAVILAAGSSTRFGSPKQLARVGSRTMLQRVVDAARGAGLEPIVAVVPPTLELEPGVTRVVNVQPAAGLSRSLRLGMAAVPPGVPAAVILLGDQPTVPIRLIRELLGRGEGERPVVATQGEGRVGPPVLLRREAFDLVEEVKGDRGLASVLEGHRELVGYVDVERHPVDVDTPEELAALRKGERRSRRD